MPKEYYRDDVLLMTDVEVEAIEDEITKWQTKEEREPFAPGIRRLSHLYRYVDCDLENIEVDPPLTEAEVELLIEMQSENRQQEKETGSPIIWEIPYD